MDYKKIMMDILRNGIEVDMDRETSIEFFEKLHGFLLKEVKDPIKIFLEEENLIVVESKYFYPIFSIKYFDGALLFLKKEESMTKTNAHGVKNVIMKTLEFIKQISEMAKAIREDSEVSPSEDETSEYSEDSLEVSEKVSNQVTDDDDDDDSDDDSELWL